MSSKAKTTPTKEEAKPALVPQLRFPAFRGAERWETKRLGDVGNVRMCKRIFKDQTSAHGDIPFYKIGTFGGAPDAYISQALFESYRNNFPFPKNGAVLISAAGTIGRAVRYKGELAYFQDSNIVWLDNSENLIADNFLFYLYQLIDWSPSVGAIQRLYNENILGTQVKFPSIPEQQKIAECLSLVDELMAAQARKVAALKTHKKGLMQQLFPREGETQPRLRFPEFQNAGEWEQIRLGQLGELVSGLTYSPEDVREAGLLVLRSSNVQNGQISLEDCVYVDPNVKGANVTLPEDILICVRNGSASLIGKNAIIPKGMPLCTHGAFMTVFRSKSARFVIQLFQTAKYQEQVAGDLGATINSINGSQLIKYKFAVPKPAEQKKLADFLSSIDVVIHAQAHKVEALNTHKRGLMQALFPSSLEVEE